MKAMRFLCLSLFVMGLAVGAQAQYYVVDFEAETKGAYDDLTPVELNGLEWEMNQAVIGNLPADWKNGSKSARFRGYEVSAMTMLEDVTNGIGAITFQYRRYGTDTQVDWKVEYSTNAGLDWTQIGADFSAPASDEVQTFAEDVGVEGDVRIRIVRATADGNTSNIRRLNIDDIEVYAFGESLPSGTLPIITLNPEGAEKDVRENEEISFDVIASQEPGDAGQETELYATELPSDATFPPVDGPAPVQSTFHWTPDVVGVYTAIFEAADADGVTTQMVTITVTKDTVTPLPISAGAPVSEGFDSIGTSAAATLPQGWKADKPASVRSVGVFADAGTATERAGGHNLSATAQNGIYNFGAPETGDEDRAVGFLSSNSGTASGNLYVSLVNAGETAIDSLNIEYTVEKYRRGSSPQGYQIQLHYSPDGVTWTSAGASFRTEFEADADNMGYNVAPGETVPVSGTLELSGSPIPVDGLIYLAWNYSVREGTTISSAQALAVDNVVISADEAEFSVFVDKAAGFRVEQGTEEVITATAQGGEEPYDYDWETDLAGDYYAYDGDTFTILDTAPVGSYFAKVTVTDAESDEADTTVNFTVAPKYDITITDPENGTVETDPEDSAFADDEVEIIVVPAGGYVIDMVTVIGADSSVIPVTDNTFTMPAQAVTVTVTFEPEPVPPGLLVLYDFDGPTSAPATTALNLTASLFVPNDDRTISYPSGNPGVAISATGWGEVGRYWEFSVTVAGGYEMAVNELSFDERASGTGPTSWFLRSSLDDFASDLATGDVDTVWDTETIPLTLEGITGTIEFRLYGEGASGAAGTWRIDNVELSGTVEIDDPDPDPDPVDVVIELPDGVASVKFLSQDGVSYTLQYTEDLMSGIWTGVDTQIGDGGELELEDDEEADVRIYRVVTP